MITYWIYKFEVEDRDIGVVDYATFEEAKNIPLPTVSMCFVNPFLSKKLNETDPKINSALYAQYLNGEIFNETFNHIDYENVTLSLQNYFLGGSVRSRNGTHFRNASSQFKHKIIFSGFYDSAFVKCFEVAVNKTGIPSIRYVGLYYNTKKLLNDLDKKVKIELFFEFPGQFLMATHHPTRIKLSREGVKVRSEIRSMEILMRRETRNKRCTRKWRVYDELVLKKHIKINGCSPPYFRPYKNVDKCNAKEDIQKSKYDFHEIRSKYFPKPCQRISKIQTHVTNFPSKGKFGFQIMYPEELKLITQSKEVDVHALIGNIGGYIGLLIGKSQYSIIVFATYIIGK